MAGGVDGRRHVPFRAVTNLRDIGGLRAEGGWSRRGVVLRSDSLHNLEPSELTAFRALGVETVFDLRREDEVEDKPGPVPIVHLPMPSRRLGDTDRSDLQTADDGERWLFEDYCGMLEHGHQVFRRIVAHVATARGATLFHCMGGKDRTGITAALLLSAIGVSRSDVLDDYELTSSLRGPGHTPWLVDAFVASGIGRPAAEAVLGTPRWAMEAALQRVEDGYGSVEAYLVERCGVPDATLVDFRRRLVEA